MALRQLCKGRHSVALRALVNPFGLEWLLLAAASPAAPLVDSFLDTTTGTASTFATDTTGAGTTHPINVQGTAGSSAFGSTSSRDSSSKSNSSSSSASDGHTLSDTDDTVQSWLDWAASAGAKRRGYGAKVALPATNILQEVIVGHPATIKLRAYHIGARIHIGQVIPMAHKLGCKTNAGRDYCIIWLKPVTHMPSAVAAALQATGVAGAKLESSSTAKQLGSQEVSWPGVTRGLSMQLGAGTPPLLVVYRYGSVVFAGISNQKDRAILNEYVPFRLRYRTGNDDTTWAMKDPQPQPDWLNRQPCEEHTVVVNPNLQGHAAKGTDQVQLRVLDIGAVRVITSVLAQSAALAYYERSVQEALQDLAKWRARDRRVSPPGSSGIWALFAGKQEQTLFKIIAASALVINEARQLLEMAEPAWDYHHYHTMWSLTAAEFELERRFKALEMKLRQVEKEAKYDVKDRAGRRYSKLEQSVVWLLVVSCALAALEVSKKALQQIRNQQHPEADGYTVASTEDVDSSNSNDSWRLDDADSSPGGSIQDVVTNSDPDNMPSVPLSNDGGGRQMHNRQITEASDSSTNEVWGESDHADRGSSASSQSSSPAKAGWWSWWRKSAK